MFKPGESGNIEGRKKGSLNKKTVLWNRLSTKFVDVHSQRIDDYLDELWKTDKPKFVELYVSLIGYHRPKLKAMDYKFNDKNREFVKDPFADIIASLGMNNVDQETL